MKQKQKQKTKMNYYLDCYLNKNDAPGYPSQSFYIDNKDLDLVPILKMLLKYFDRVEETLESRSQNPISLTRFLIENPSFIG